VNTRREEEEISAAGHRAGGAGVAAEQCRVLVKVASGLMKKHRKLEVEFSRVLNLAQNAPCFLLKAEKLICCPTKSKFIAARRKFYENSH
jgi:hypothetical protein